MKPHPHRALLLCSVLALAGAAAAFATPPEDRDDDDRVKITTWKFLQVVPGGDCRSIDFDAMSRAIAQALGSTPTDVGTARRVFDRFSFQQIEALLKAKKAAGISDANSHGLAEARREMSRRSMTEALKKLDPSGTLHVGMLDSGNKSSGIASDVDQTVFLWPREEAKRLGIDEAKLIEEFGKQFALDHGHAPEHFGIECMNGADFFPDWRQCHTVGEFAAEARRVVLEKRKNPEAYRSEGQLKSQAEGRGYAELKAFGRELERLGTEAARVAGEIDDVEARLAGGDDAALSAKRTALETELRAIQAELVEVARLSPWTEIGADETGKVVARTDQDPRGKVLKNEPEMAERFAFDGAYDNWIMFEHHPANRIKYLLRSVAEGVGVLVKLHDVGGSSVVRPFDYDVHFGAGRRSLCQSFVEQAYGHLAARGDGTRLTQERVRKALDAAAKGRLRHKNADKPGGGKWTLADVYAEYLPDDPNMPLAIRLETAKARWESDAREIMLENLLLTVKAPGEILTGRFGASELAGLRARNPGLPIDANVLRVAAELQLFHGIHDLVSREHALELLEADPAKQAEMRRNRMTDPVDRLLAEVERSGDRAYLDQLKRLARRAASARLAADPHFAKDPSLTEAVLEVMRDAMHEQIRSAYDGCRAVAESLKNGEYTPHAVATHVLTGLFSRAGGVAAEVFHALGFEGHVEVLHPNADFDLPALRIEFGQPAFSGKKLLVNLMTTGNLDSALQVMDAYLDGGASAAAWAAAREVVMNFPGVAQGSAVWEAVAHGRPQGAVMMGSAMLIPGVGEAYILCSIASTSVRIAGKLVLDPLKDDVSDTIYQGFIGVENRFHDDERSQRAGLLDPVAVRVIPYSRKDDFGKTIVDAAGTPRTFFALAPYSAAQAFHAELVKTEAQYGFASAAGLLGGGEDFERELPFAEDWLRHPRAVFEAKRASLFPHYEVKVADFLHAKGVEDLADLIVLRRPEGATEILREFFAGIVRDWIHGTGEFEGRVDAENEVLIDTVAPPDRVEERAKFEARLAHRMTTDFLRSFEIVRGLPSTSPYGNGSLEDSMRINVRAAWRDHVRFEVTQAMVALEDARRAARNAALAFAVHDAVLDRAPTAPAPRIHVRPRVVVAKDERGAAAETLDVSVSVIADPVAFPPPYSFDASWGTDVTTDGVAVDVSVIVKDARGREVGRTAREPIGVLDRGSDGAPSPRNETPGGPVSFRVAPQAADAARVEFADAHLHCDFEAAQILSCDVLWAFFDHPKLERGALDFRVLRDDGATVAAGTVTRANLADRGSLPRTACAFQLRGALAGNYAFEVRVAYEGASVLGQGSDVPDPWERIGTFRADRALLHFQGFLHDAPRPPARASDYYPDWRMTLDAGDVDRATGRIAVDLEASWLPMGTRTRVRAKSRVELTVPVTIDPLVDPMGAIRYRIAALERVGDDAFRARVHPLVATRELPPSASLVTDRPAPQPFSSLKNKNVPGGLGALERLETELGGLGGPNNAGEIEIMTRGPFAGRGGRPSLSLAGHLHGSTFCFPVAFQPPGSGPTFGYIVYGASAEPYSGPMPPPAPRTPDAGGTPTADAGRDPRTGTPIGEGGNDPDTNGSGDRAGAGRDRPGARTTPIDPAALDPNAPDVAPLIREWIVVAEPPQNATEGARFHYNEWGLVLGSSRDVVITGSPGRPDDVAGRTPEEYVWAARDRLDSVDHCTLGEFVVARLEGRGVEGCRGRYARRAPDAAARGTPDFTGATLADARAAAERAGVKVRPVGGDPAPSPETEFTVQSQDPAPGAPVSPGSLVEVRVFGPYPRVESESTVPDLIGLAATDVRARLEDEGLAARLVGADPAPTPSQSLCVAWQEPPAGTPLARGGTVVVHVWAEFVADAGDAEPIVPEPQPIAPDPEPIAPEPQPIEREPQPIAPITPAAAQSGAPYFVAFRNFLPKPLREVPDGTKMKEWIAGLTIADVAWEASPEPLFVRVSGGAVAFYGDSLRPGAQVALPFTADGTMRQTGQPIHLDAALLLEVERVASDASELDAAYGAKAQRLHDANGLLEIDGADGRFSRDANDANSSGRIAGGPFEPGWSDAMKDKNLDLLRTMAQLFDCFLATAVYAVPRNDALDALRRFRDDALARTAAGTALIDAYYCVGPHLARGLRAHPDLRSRLVPAFDRLAAMLDSHVVRSPLGRAVLAVATARAAAIVAPLVPTNLSREALAPFDPLDPCAPLPWFAPAAPIGGLR